MKLLLVADSNIYSTYDVYNGYITGFQRLKIPFDVVDLPCLLGENSMESAMGKILAKMLIKSNNFTHVLFVAGTVIPDWLLESRYHIKSGIIATDDPHSTNMLIEKIANIDYYFTNEKDLVGKIPKSFYLPTGVAEPRLSNHQKDPKYACDICFIGSIYPQRVRPMETIINWGVRNNKKMTIIGPIQGLSTYGEPFVPKESIIHKYAKNGIVNNDDTFKTYCNAHVVINMERDPEWSPAFLNGNPHYVKCNPYSANPRMYEIAASKATQMYIGNRQEAEDIFGNNLFYSDPDDSSIMECLDYIFSTPLKQLNKMANNCFETVKKHTYSMRAAQLLNVLIRG